ncbi:MAG: hypothetical protein D6701_02555, partial [Gemmatimonadetes bacterium]
HGTLEAWARARGIPVSSGGRGAAYVVPAPDAEGARWVVRHFRRGGGVRWLGDRYLRGGHPRPFAELAASEAVRARGIETPRVVAAALYEGPVFYRADLVTECVEDAVPLAATLSDDAPDRPGPDAATAVAAALRLAERLAEAGVEHADLNAHNVLFRRSDEGRWTPVLLDLDRCRVGRRARSPARMRARLLRSLGKVMAEAGGTLDLDALARARAARLDPPGHGPDERS